MHDAKEFTTSHVLQEKTVERQALKNYLNKNDALKATYSKLSGVGKILFDKAFIAGFHAQRS